MGEEYQKICSYDNLLSAFKKAKKGRTLKPYVKEFEKNLDQNILELRTELIFYAYRPKPLQSFIIKDPKTRKISKSAFRDRVVHHAICNIIETRFEKRFIYDSYANRKEKGTLKAIQRFDQFKIKVSKNNHSRCYIFKADIKKYFDSVDHEILLSLLKKRIQDEQVIWLITIVLKNYNSNEVGKAMPLGNLTSQFFANIYLHELDHFVKQKLHIKYYIRYVDDFVIMHNNKQLLQKYKEDIEQFLEEKLKLELHSEKSRIFELKQGLDFLGFKIFFYHKRIKKKNWRKFMKKKQEYYQGYKEGITEYDSIYNFIEGWSAYAQQGNTYKIIRGIKQELQEYFPNEMSKKEINKHLKYS